MELIRRSSTGIASGAIHNDTTSIVMNGPYLTDSSEDLQVEWYGHPMRFVVMHSSHLQAKDMHAFSRALDKELQDIRKQVKTLVGSPFACQKDAEKALAEFSKKSNRWKWHHVSFTVEAETYALPREQRGRPKTGSVAEQGTRYWIQATEPKRREEEVREHENQLGMFILLTSRTDKKEWSSLRVLQTYKGQDAAETRFRILKDPAMLDAVYLKTPSRIEALGIVFVMALLVYGVLEWRVREQMNAPGRL